MVFSEFVSKPNSHVIVCSFFFDAVPFLDASLLLNLFAVIFPYFIRASAHVYVICVCVCIACLWNDWAKKFVSLSIKYRNRID